MNPLTVDPTQTPGLAEIVASLPLSLAPVDDGPAQLASVTGAPGWPARARAAVDAGAMAVIVDAPTETGAVDISVPGDGAGRVVLAWAFAANPGVLAAADAALPLRSRAVLAEARLQAPVGSNADAALLDVLIAASRVFGTMAALRGLHRDAHGWHLAGRLSSGAPLTATIVLTNAGSPNLRLRLVTEDGGLTVTVPAPDTATPAEVRVLRPAGEQLLPTSWETSRRASWRRAVHIATGTTRSEDLAELHRVNAVASALSG